PGTAVVERAGKPVVFAIEGERARVRAVTPGQNYGDLRLVEGLPGGTRVVRAPPAALSDGARVAVAKP
ncbi:MAG TPA: hypothetical protein VI195_00780, partial [Steroidobacteraceae bacterium]